MVTTYNHFPQIANALDDVLGQVVRKGAVDLSANMQKQIRANGQIDTGFMINSVYVVTSESSTYAEQLESMTRPSKAGKRSKRKSELKSRMDQRLLPEIATDTSDKHTAWVAVGADYGYWQNYGTRFQPARPFLEPSIETTRPSFEEAISRVEDALGRAS